MEESPKGLSFTQEEVDAVRFIVSSRGWQTFFVPMLEKLHREWVVQLIDPSIERKDDRSDDFIRGCISTIQAILDFPSAILAEDEEDKRREAAEEAERQRLLLRAKLGRTGPLPPDDDPVYLDREA